MPPRYAYWTIIAGGLPTAFRAAERDELLPTFRRIHEKHPDAEMKFFARGKLWASPEEARRVAEARRTRKADWGSDPGDTPARGRDWRPGGEHRDPRQKFKDAKKAGNLARRRRRFERRDQGAQAFGSARGNKPQEDSNPPQRHSGRPPSSRRRAESRGRDRRRS